MEVVLPVAANVRTGEFTMWWILRNPAVECPGE
jgi:hypothetical protein